MESFCELFTERDSGEIYKSIGRDLREICKTWDFQREKEEREIWEGMKLERLNRGKRDS